MLARELHTATLLPDGRVLLAGGRPVARRINEEARESVADAGAFSELEIYDPATGSSQPAGHLVKARYGHTAILLPDGRVLVAGGTDGKGAAVLEAEIYEPLVKKDQGAPAILYHPGSLQIQEGQAFASPADYVIPGRQARADQSQHPL